MSFWHRAFRNMAKGAGVIFVGILVLLVIFSVGAPPPLPGAENRLLVTLAFGTMWGATMGFCCTSPTNPRKMISLLLVLLAVIASMLVFLFFFFSFGSSEASEFGNALFLSLITAGLAAFVCGIS